MKIGIYTLHDLKHAEKEAEKINSLTLATLPRRRFDPKKVAYNALDQAKLAKFEHKEDIFEDLFASAESLYQVKSLAIHEYNDEGLVEFNRLREKRLQTLPLDLLATTPTTKSSEPEQRCDKEPPITSKQQEEVHDQRQEETQGNLQRQEETQAKTQEESGSKVNDDTQIDPKLLQE